MNTNYIDTLDIWTKLLLINTCMHTNNSSYSYYSFDVHQSCNADDYQQGAAQLSVKRLWLRPLAVYSGRRAMLEEFIRNRCGSSLTKICPSLRSMLYLISRNPFVSFHPFRPPMYYWLWPGCLSPSTLPQGLVSTQYTNKRTHIFFGNIYF